MKLFNVLFALFVLSSVLFANEGILLKNSNLRKAPSLDASVIKVIPKGTKISINEKHGEWVAVENGYIFAAFVGKEIEKEVKLIHQITQIQENGKYLLDAKFVKFEKCDKFGWCKLNGENSYVKQYLFAKKSDGRYMKKGPEKAYIYKKVPMPVVYDPNEKIVNVKDFKGAEREKLNKKKNTKFGYVKLKELVAKGYKEEKVAPKKVVENKPVVKEIKKEIVKDTPVKPAVEKQKVVTKTDIPVKKEQVDLKPKEKNELSADEKRLIELQNLIKQYDKQLEELDKNK
jgi:hypothetical protein